MDPIEGGDRVAIRGLRLWTTIGVRAHEAGGPQPVEVDVDAWYDARAAAASDDLALALDYARLRRAIEAHASTTRHLLLEALGEAIARVVVVDFGARRAVVRVAKPRAARSARIVGVVIDRTPDDF